MKLSLMTRNAWLLMLLCGAADSFAFDRSSILQLISAARPPLQSAPGLALAAPDPQATLLDQQQRLKAEETAWNDLMSTCEGRFGYMRRSLERQVSRAEMLALGGGLVGVVGAVATCPHCAALAAGLAGIANPLQQTFRENSDTPADTRADLDRLSTAINSELGVYRNLPPAIPGDAAFDGFLRARLDQLQIATASCAFFAAKTQQQTTP